MTEKTGFCIKQKFNISPYVSYLPSLLSLGSKYDVNQLSATHSFYNKF